MINISKQTIWFIIILCALAGIYFLYFNKDQNKSLKRQSLFNFSNSKSNSNETSIVQRKKINNKHYQSKKIHVSSSNPLESAKSIKLMTQKLTQKLNMTNNKKISNLSQLKNVPINYSNPNKYIIKLYSADWCPHCVDFKPIWNQLKSKYNHIKFVDVDCTNEQPNLSFVNGYPTIAIFDSSDVYIENYQNERSFDQFNSYLKALLE